MFLFSNDYTLILILILLFIPFISSYKIKEFKLELNIDQALLLIKVYK
jgi:hypothetical protein